MVAVGLRLEVEDYLARRPDIPVYRSIPATPVPSGARRIPSPPPIPDQPFHATPQTGRFYWWACPPAIYLTDLCDHWQEFEDDPGGLADLRDDERGR